jgi:prepilin-type N-terminal cleavage/methylation domain-containing protein
MGYNQPAPNKFLWMPNLFKTFRLRRCFGQKSFTIIELIVVMLIIAIIAIPGAHLMFHFIQNSVYIPNQLNTDMLAMDALDLMLNGDEQAKGLRFSRRIINMGPNSIHFINQDNQEMGYLFGGDNKLYRIVFPGPFEWFPYYQTNTVALTGAFAFLDQNEAFTAVPDNVRIIFISASTQTGNGSYNNWQGQSTHSTLVAVKRFQ